MTNKQAIQAVKDADEQLKDGLITEAEHLELLILIREKQLKRGRFNK